MISLSAKIRTTLKKRLKTLRQKDQLPAVLYGPKMKKAMSLQVNYSSFEQVYKEAGESSLISLEVSGDNSEQKDQKVLVLIHDIQRDPLSDRISHADFYQAPLEEKIVVKIPIIFEGNSPAVKELGGTFVKYITETEVKAFPQNLPKEIKVSVDALKTFQDNILIKGLALPEGVEILRGPEEIVASVLPPEKVEEELEKPIEEKVEDVKVVEKEKKEEEVKEGEAGE